MNPALRYLLWRSLVGSIRSRLGQLKEGKYWLGLAGIFLYFGFFLFPALMQKRLALRPAVGGLSFGLMLLVSFGMSWLFQSRRSGIGFTEAEVEMLFPAPLSRQQLLHYRLAKAQAGLLFSTFMIVCFVSVSWRMPSFLAGWLSFYLLFNLIHMHGLVAILVCRRWKGYWWIWLVRGGMAALILAPVAIMWMQLPADIAQAQGLKELSERLLQSDAGRWIWFWHTLGTLPFVEGNQAFYMRLGMVLGVWVVCYGIILKLGVGFEEQELENAKARADAMRAIREGRSAPVKDKPVRPAWFPLPKSGPLWLTLAWKNVVSATRHVPRVLALISVIVLVQFIVIAVAIGGSSHMPLKIGIFAVVCSFLLAFSGSQFMKEDLRTSLSNIELIKSLPLPPLALVRGEVLGAASIVIAGCYGCLLIFVLSLGIMPSQTVPIRSVWLFASMACFLLPAVCLVTFVVDNSLALVFPSWMVIRRDASTQQAGIEQLGRGVINMIIKMLALLCFSVLPGFFAGLTWFLAGLLQSIWLFPVGAALYLAVIMVQIEVAMRWMAEQFHYLDPSSTELSI